MLDLWIIEQLNEKKEQSDQPQLPLYREDWDKYVEPGENATDPNMVEKPDENRGVVIIDY